MASQSIICPICRAGSLPHEAFVLYMAVHCPICWDTVPQATCLPCGHAICNADFESLGGRDPRRHHRSQSPPGLPRGQRSPIADPAEGEVAAKAYSAAAGLSFLAAAASSVTLCHPASSLVAPLVAVVAIGLGGLAASGTLSDDTPILPSQQLPRSRYKPAVVKSLTMAAATSGVAVALNAAAAAEVASAAAATAALAVAIASEHNGIVALITGAQIAAQVQAAITTSSASVASVAATAATASAAVIVPASAVVVSWGIITLMRSNEDVSQQ